MKKRIMIVLGCALGLGVIGMFSDSEPTETPVTKPQEEVKQDVETPKEEVTITLDDYLDFTEANLKTNFHYSDMSYDKTNKTLTINVGMEGVGNNMNLFQELGTYPPEWKTATKNIDRLAGEIYLGIDKIEKGVKISMNIVNYDDTDYILYSTYNGVTTVYDVLGDLK